MGLGNQGGGGNSGNKRSNHNYEHRNLLTLGAISAFVGAGATEATLQLVLTAIQSGSEFEARLVEDAVSVTWLEVRTWNTSSGTWNPPLYYPAGSNTPGSPTLPVTYINNSAVLATIASNTTGLATEVTLGLIEAQIALLNFIGTALEVDVTSSVLPTGAATEVTLAALNAKFNTLGQKASAASHPVVLSSEQEALIDGIEGLLTTINTSVGLAATEITLAATNTLLTTIDTVLDNILLDTTAILADTNTLSTPTTGLGMTIDRRTDATGSPIAAGKRRISVFNAGAAAGDVLGGSGNILPGESITWEAGNLRDTLAAFAYDGTGTTLVITTVG